MVYMLLLRVVVEGIGEATLTSRRRVVDVDVGVDRVILQGETVISTVHGSLRGVPLGGSRRHIGVDGVSAEGDGRPRIHDPAARRDGELHGTIDIDIAVFILRQYQCSCAMCWTVSVNNFAKLESRFGQSRA